jgi:cytochrome c oxidase cbb3-type subunit 3
MPAGMAFGDDVAVVAAYVAGGLKGEQPAAFAACASCHGANGEGMDFVAPSLKTYNADLVNTLLSNGSKKGEIGKMPAFKDKLNAKQKEAVAAYIAKGAK